MIVWREEVRQRKGIALALSGGGFRATLFHLGALRRLNELGILSKLDAISSVSGGSIAAACLADAMMTSGASFFDAFAKKVYDVTSYNLRRTILLKRAIPTNWGTGLAELVARELEGRVTKKSLADLPRSPQFLFCATDMVFGVNWVYTHDGAGDYQAGYATTGLEKVAIAHAAAASACFPPVFAPIGTDVPPENLREGDEEGSDADECRRKIRLTDGGVYDNMGLEPVWKAAKTVLVSDAGGLFDYDKDRGTLNDVQRYPDVMGNQSLSLRRRWLLASFKSRIGPGDLPDFGGTYWRTAGARSSYDPADNTGYSKDLAELIARIRTDLNEFSEAERQILENHGYLMADIAIKKHVPELYSPVPVLIPYKGMMDPGLVRDALKNSSKRSL